jgi:hypothetical protein
MEYQDIKYLHPKKILAVKRNGMLMELHVPIRVIVIIQFTAELPVNTITHVEEVQPDQKHKIIYRIFDTWYPYWGFTLK